MFRYLRTLGNAELENQYDTFADHIGESGYSYDITMSYTLKALLHDRATGHFFIDSFIVNGTRNVADEDLANEYIITGGTNLLYLNVDEDKDEYTRFIKSCEPVLFSSGYVSHDAAKMFMTQRNFDMRFYINEKHKRTIVIGNKINAPCHHVSQSLLPVILPWYFEDKPITDNEKTLLATLLDSTPDNYIAWMNSFIKGLDLRASTIRAKLKGYTASFAHDKEQQLKDKIKEFERKIQEYEDLITAAFKNKEVVNDQLTGLLMREGDEDEDTSLVDFFIASKALKLREVYASDIYVEIKTTLDNYDADMYEKFRANPRNSFNLARNYYSYDLDDGRLLMDAIFKDQKVRVNMKAMFILNFSNARVSIERSFSNFTSDCLDNPHLTEYRCLGNNEPKLRQALRDRDYIIALSTCISIAGNLNISETNNDENFMRYLFNTDKKVIKLPDGTDVTVKAAIEWLKERS